jgi:Tol biopolymer transport system component
VALLATQGCRDEPRPAPAAAHASAASAQIGCVEPPGALRGRVVLASERGGGLDVYSVPAAGGDAARLTTDPAADYPGPASPDGRAMALVRARDEPGGRHAEELFLLDQGPSGGARRVAGPARRLRHPAFSPDGLAIVAESDLDGAPDLYRFDLTGAHPPERLTTTAGGAYEPDVSPSGRTIAFAASQADGAEIFTLDLATRRVDRLTYSPEDDTSPRFSPDGARLAFVRARRGTAQVYLMDANGEHPRPLRAPGAAPEGRAERDLVWSPDGQALAFVEATEGRATVLVVAAADGAILARTDGPHVDEQPAFSPDGAHVAFVSDRDGDPEIYRMRKGGSCLARLTRSPGADWLPRWLP